MKPNVFFRFLTMMTLLCAERALAAPTSFTASGHTIDVYDFVEVTAQTPSSLSNCFTDADFTGELQHDNEAITPVMGFCDSNDPAVFKIRFLANRPGAYRYSVHLRTASGTEDHQGSFTAVAHARRGLVRVDPAHPFHFIWEGTGEHYYWNGLTTYALMGWQDEAYIRAIIDRAARLKVNRLRVTLNGPRVADASRWYEPVKPSSQFRFLFGPWIGAHPDNVHQPDWDVTRYDVAFWQKYERMVRYARGHDVVISVIFFLDGEDQGADPFGRARAFSEEEKRYYRYAAARLAAYSNVMWDVTNEWHLFRSAWWVQQMGSYLKAVDPWKHLVSCHGRDEFPWSVSFWPDFAMFQLWDEHGDYEPMLARRRLQAATGRPMPQINEEYGYEDHYPAKWGDGRKPPARSAGNRLRLAWRIAMAGCYQTSGERANRGDGQPPATPGGWINGGFDPSMTMLEGYRRLVDFFTSMEYWRLEPAPEQVSKGLFLLAEQGRQYVFYFPDGHPGTAELAAGRYRARWFNPRTGRWNDAAEVELGRGQRWSTPPPPSPDDWILVLQAAKASA